MKTTLGTLILLLLCNLAYCQSNKEIKLNKIKSITTFQNDKDESPSSAYKDAYEAYDKNGNTTLKIRYKKDGSVEKKETARFDKNQNKVEEFEYDGKNEVVTHKVFVYNAFQKKTEEIGRAHV